MKKTFLLALISFVITGCSDGSVQIRDNEGYIYTFKHDFIFCRPSEFDYKIIFCEGQAIKENMAGQRYVIKLTSRLCDYKVKDWDPGTIEAGSLVCRGARKLGKYTPTRR